MQKTGNSMQYCIIEFAAGNNLKHNQTFVSLRGSAYRDFYFQINFIMCNSFQHIGRVNFDFYDINISVFGEN